MTSGTNPTAVQYLVLDGTHDTHYHVQSRARAILNALNYQLSRGL